MTSAKIETAYGPIAIEHKPGGGVVMIRVGLMPLKVNLHPEQAAAIAEALRFAAEQSAA